MQLGDRRESVERDSKQWVDTVAQEHANGRDVFGDCDDPLEEFQSRPFIMSCDSVPNECAHHIDGQSRLRDAAGIALFGKQIEICFSAIAPAVLEVARLARYSRSTGKGRRNHVRLAADSRTR